MNKGRLFGRLFKKMGQLDLAITHFESDINNLESIFELGRLHYEIRNFNKAFYWLKKSAHDNHIESQYYLGYIFTSGEKIDPDVGNGIKYFTMAAKNGHLESQYQLSRMYGGYYKDFKNEEECVKWCLKAAKAGHQAAINILNKEE